MSPRDTVSSRPSAFGQVLVGPTGLRKASLRGSKVIRVTSPLTPWEDTLIKKRKSSLKGNSRQLKSLKTNLKDSKKKNKKENDKSFDVKLRSDDGKLKSGCSFPHHADINKYMKDYKKERRAKLQDNCGYEVYGLDEITKAYESLGIPKFPVPRISRLSNASGRNFLPPVTDQPMEEENIEAKSEILPLVSDSEEESENEIENEIPSPEARERRNNLNLSPLRKHVRLPDMSNFPVQTVSGINLLELTRLATARAEASDMSHKRETATALTKIRFLSSEKKLLPTSTNLQEKVMCRVVELSLPNNYEFQLPAPSKNNLTFNEIIDKPQPSLDDVSNHGYEDRAVQHRLIKKSHFANDKLKKLDLGEPQDDALTFAIGTSRSCQSSVLSHAVSSLSPNSTPTNHTPTVKEILTAAVKDLSPKKLDNKQSLQPDKTAQKSPKTHELEINLDKSKHDSAKQLVSLKTYRKLCYKPALRKYIEGLYQPTDEKRLFRDKKSCVIEGKTLQKSKKSDSSPLPSLRVSPNKSALKNPEITKMDHFLPQTDSAKLRKRARQRQKAAEKYEQFKRAIALDTKRHEEAKLAIVSKCQTVVKSQVSIKTVAI